MEKANADTQIATSGNFLSSENRTQLRFIINYPLLKNDLHEVAFRKY